MIAKKMWMWIGAGLLSVASIPAIGATLSHRAKNQAAVKPVSHGFKLIHTAAKPTVKTVSHAKPTKLVAKHAKKIVHAKLATKKTAKHATLGVLAMHSGHATLGKTSGAKVIAVKNTAPAKRVAGHLLAATTKVKTGH